MNSSHTLARQFARLVWLLVHDSGNVGEQKSALRAILAASIEGAVTFTLERWRLVANGTPLPDGEPEIPDLAAQLIGHSVRELSLSQSSTAADVLAVARALATEPLPGNGGRAVTDAIRLSDKPTVTAVVDSIAPPAMTPAPSLFPQPIRASARVSGSYLAFAATQAPQGSIAELLVKLAAPVSVDETTQLLEDVLVLVDRAAEEGKTELVADAICALVAGEDAREGAGHKLAYGMALRRTNKPRLLRMVASLLPRHRERADEYTAVLARMGQDGADAAIEELTAAQSMGDRRILFDTLVKLKASIPALLHMLGDPRWYVVRNAADLLGEMPTPEAEAPLTKLLKHDDERVRRAAASALAKIGTGNAFAALRIALRNSSAQVRLVAAAGLASWKRNTSAHSLTVALDTEADGDVQLQIIETLGRVATADAVHRLMEIAKPGGVVFGRKDSAHRLAAVAALGTAGSAAALAALKSLADDRDKAVRDAAAGLVAALRNTKASA